MDLERDSHCIRISWERFDRPIKLLQNGFGDGGGVGGFDGGVIVGGGDDGGCCSCA